MKWSFTFPQGFNKALALSYDDGQIHDRRLVEILNRHGLKGTFHLNSGSLSSKGFVEREEVASLYKGHEISAHGVSHAWLSHLSDDLAVSEILEDRRALESLAGYPVRGMSYAFGSYALDAPKKLKILGIEYARTVAATHSFAVPANFLTWHPTCHHNDRLMEMAENFINLPAYARLAIFYVWGHSYEFNGDGNWDLIEGFASKMEGAQGVWKATSIEIARYIAAARSLVTSVNGDIAHNPAGISLWIEAAGEIRCIAPGGTIIL
ncbi:MAG: polysaccharide deacetylase family protein [Clostridiales bacterium]|nr:polysaccharide deacetylase family protein [Clostridiales bacterium]